MGERNVEDVITNSNKRELSEGVRRVGGVTPPSFLAVSRSNVYANAKFRYSSVSFFMLNLLFDIQYLYLHKT